MRPSDPYQPSPLAAAEGVLDRIVGSYRLKGVLGRGGMGEVYLAEHVRMGQRVALKLILPEHRERPEAVQRFHNEARALAKVSHPGVVAVFDVSELPDGSCYLVLEYLAGSSLRERLRTPGEPLSLAHSLHILQQAAVALAAVHHAGIIHRDLSPANLMLVPDGGSPPFRVKLLDFGLAKQSQAEAHTDTSQNTTRDGAVIGTPKYMAPEQGLDAGGVDERADVYALGVIGFELLAGRPPFEAPSSWELLGMHMREPPPSLPSVAADGQSVVPAELAALIGQMLAKSPLGRPTMTEVAERLAALSAGFPSERLLVSRQQGQPRRQWWLLGMLSVLLLASVTSTGLYAYREHRLAELRRQETLTATGELLGVINRSLRPIPGATTASHSLLDTTAKLLGELQQQAPSDLEVRESLIRLHTLRGEIFRNHGGLPDAQREFQQAIVLSESLLTAQPERDSYRARLASAYDGLADVSELQLALSEARQLYEKSLTIRLALLARAPDDATRRQEAVASYLLHGDLLRTMGLQRQALLDYERAEALLGPMWKREPDKKSYRWQMCGVLYRISYTQLSLGKIAHSLAYAERALELLRRIAPTDQQGASYHLLLSRVLQTRGEVRDRLGRTTDAEHDYSQAFVLLQGLLKAAPQDVQCRRALIDSGSKAIDVWLRLGKLDSATVAVPELLATAEALLQTDGSHQGHKWRLAGSLQRVGDVQLARGELDAARRTYQRALELQESLRVQSPDSMRHRERMVLLWERLGDVAGRGTFPEQALSPWTEALTLLLELARIDPSATDVSLEQARLLRKRGTLHARLGQLALARADWQRARGLLAALLAVERSDATAQREQILVELAATSESYGEGEPSERRQHRQATLALLAKLRADGLFDKDQELQEAAGVGSPTSRANILAPSRTGATP